MSFLEIVEPACRIPIGIRTEENQNSCTKAERNLYLGVLGIGVGLGVLYVVVTPQKPRPQNLAVATAVVGGLGLLAVVLIPVYRKRRWRAETTAVSAMLANQQATNLLVQRANADATTRIADSTGRDFGRLVGNATR